MSTIKVDTVQSTGGGAVTLTNQAASKAFARYHISNNKLITIKSNHLRCSNFMKDRPNAHLT